MPKKKTAEAAPNNIAGNSKKTASKTRGKPFQPGQSGNPGGRPKVPEEVKEALRASTLPAVNTLISLMNDEGTADKDRIKCAEVILNKTLGKNYQLNDTIDTQKQEAETAYIQEKTKLLKGSAPDFSLLEALGALFKEGVSDDEVE